jgi:hypothetical protein
MAAEQAQQAQQGGEDDIFGLGALMDRELPKAPPPLPPPL